MENLWSELKNSYITAPGKFYHLGAIKVTTAQCAVISNQSDIHSPPYCPQWWIIQWNSTAAGLKCENNKPQNLPCASRQQCEWMDACHVSQPLCWIMSVHNIYLHLNPDSLFHRQMKWAVARCYAKRATAFNKPAGWADFDSPRSFHQHDTQTNGVWKTALLERAWSYLLFTAQSYTLSHVKSAEDVTAAASSEGMSGDRDCAWGVVTLSPLLRWCQSASGWKFTPPAFPPGICPPPRWKWSILSVPSYMKSTATLGTYQCLIENYWCTLNSSCRFTLISGAKIQYYPLSGK